MNSNKELDSILDKTIAGIGAETIDPATVDAAAERVWARLSAENSGEIKLAGAPVERIESCADFQSLIPAYLHGELSEARALLLVDHTHECIPCRRAMKEARSGRVPIVKPGIARHRYVRPAVYRWGIAAALVIGFGLLAIPVFQRYSPFGGQFEATVQAAEGQVYQIGESTSRLVNSGQKLERGERLRTAKDAHAFVRLGDGSMIEIKDRSEFYLTKNAQGTTIHLDRGSIVVEAAKQNRQHLFVDTGDATISVTGTVFSVNHGIKGSRVSVIEGEVHLDSAGNERALRPGEQATTSRSIEMLPVKDEVAWSRNAARYASVLAGLNTLNKDLRQVARPGLRNSTHLLDLMPESTIFYAALPNLASTIAESQRIMEERISQNVALREWWQKRNSVHKGPDMDQVMSTIRQFGDYLGDEIAVSVSMDEKAEPGAPLVIAELKNSSGFREFIEQQIAKYHESEGQPNIQFVDDPLTAVSAAPATRDKSEVVYVWIRQDLFAASPKLDQLQGLARVMQSGSASAFAATPFRERIAQVYEHGAGLVVAANLEKIISETSAERAKSPNGAKNEEALKQLGVLSVKYFVLDQSDSGGKTHTQAVLSFNDPQRGLPSWLAAPGPMGALEYVSPDANIVAGFVVKDPVHLVDDLLGVMQTVSPELRQNLEKLQSDHGLDIRNDIAKPLGGEFAFAVDGPILPTPSWKLVFQVNDPDHLQQTLEQVVGEVNKEAAKFGKSGLVWDRADMSGLTYYTLRSVDFGLEVNYTYQQGYMIVGPTRALVERAVRSREAGNTLLRSSKFLAGLPANTDPNFSALFYHNLAPLVQPFADRIATSAGSLPQEQQQAIKALAADMPATLAYAYAQGDSITFAANTEGGPFGLSPATLLGMPNALEMQHIIQQGMKKQ